MKITNAEQPLLLIHEAIAGLRAPNRFDEGEAAVVWHRTRAGALVCEPVIVQAVKHYCVYLAATDGGEIGWLPQYDVLKLTAVENIKTL